jgi:hypothetical protein
MRIRVAANVVTASREFAYLVGRQEPGRPHSPRGHEEVPTPAPSLQRFSGAQGGRPSIVERQRRLGVILDQPDRDAEICNCVEMLLKARRLELVARRDLTRKPVFVPSIL